MNRPSTDEYAEFYETYVSLVPETDINSVLANQIGEIKKLFGTIDEEASLFRYADGKWSIREVLGHLIDGERIFAYRAARIGRGDATPIEGFDQDLYIENSRFDETPLGDLLDELIHCRESNILMFRQFDERAWSFRGNASGCVVTARALAFMMAGHIRHHVAIVEQRYLGR